MTLVTVALLFSLAPWLRGLLAGERCESWCAQRTLPLVALLADQAPNSAIYKGMRCLPFLWDGPTAFRDLGAMLWICGRTLSANRSGA